MRDRILTCPWFLDFRTRRTPYLWIWIYKKICKEIRKQLGTFCTYYLYKFQIVGFQKLWKLWKGQALNNDEGPSNNILKTLVWYQYLPESMKLNFGNMGLVSFSKSPDGQGWNRQKAE